MPAEHGSWPAGRVPREGGRDAPSPGDRDGKDQAGNLAVQQVNLRRHDCLHADATSHATGQQTPTKLPGEISQTVNRTDLKGTLPGRGC